MAIDPYYAESADADDTYMNTYTVHRVHRVLPWERW